MGHGASYPSSTHERCIPPGAWDGSMRGASSASEGGHAAGTDEYQHPEPVLISALGYAGENGLGRDYVHCNMESGQ